MRSVRVLILGTWCACAGKSSLNVVLPQRSRSMCTAADVEAIRKARKQHPNSPAEAALARAEAAAPAPEDAAPPPGPSANAAGSAGGESTDSSSLADARATEATTPKRLATGAGGLGAASGAAAAARTARISDPCRPERRSSGVAETVRAFESRARGESLNGLEGAEPLSGERSHRVGSGATEWGAEPLSGERSH